MTDIPDLPEDPDAALAGEYVLRLLAPEEAAACAAREARDPAFAALVAAWRADLEPLDAAYAGDRPAARPRAAHHRPPLRRAALAPRPALEQRRPLARRHRGGRRRRPLARRIRAPPAPPPGEPQARLVSALASAAGSDVTLLAVLEPQAAVLSINRTSGAAPPGGSLELWMIEGGNPPVSLGVLPDTPLARVPLPRELADRIGPGTTLAVSSEPLGGSPTGAPTGPVLAAGPVADI